MRTTSILSARHQVVYISATNNSCQLDEEGNVLGEKIHPGTAVPPCPEEVLGRGRNLRTISLGGKKQEAKRSSNAD